MKAAAVSLVLVLLLLLDRGDSARVQTQFEAATTRNPIFPVAGGQNVTSASGLVRYVQATVHIEADKKIITSVSFCLGGHWHSPRWGCLLSRGLLPPVFEGGEVLPAGQEVQEVEV